MSKELASKELVFNDVIIKGIGTDLLDQRRIANIIEKQGERFGRRILTPQELLLWAEKANSINFVAKRFAAKEAISKALGTGIAQGIGFQQMNIYADDLGKPVVELTGEALNRAKALGGQGVLLSLSDEGDMILAFAVLR
ncbi:MAG: holo-[acyl-carrier protein] synthase [Oleispira sp.]|jgi:holo-[acyl-carrier protein] synthase